MLVHFRSPFLGLTPPVLLRDARELHGRVHRNTRRSTMSVLLLLLSFWRRRCAGL